MENQFARTFKILRSYQKKVKCLFIVVMHLATPSYFTDMPLKLKEKKKISNEHNRLKNPNWREADQLCDAIVDCRRSCDVT